MTSKKTVDIFTDEHAMSPIIGAVLVIGMTVVLGTVVLGFTSGLGEDLNEPIPNTGIDFTYNSTDDRVTTFHGGGKLLSQSNTGEMRVKGDYSGGGEWNPDTFSGSLTNEGATVSDTINSTDVIWTSNNGAVKSGETVRMVWVSPSGDRSSQLGQFTAP